MGPGGSRTLLSSLLQRQCAKWGGLNSSAGSYGHAVTWLEVGVRGGWNGGAAYKARTQENNRSTLQLQGEMGASLSAYLWKKQQDLGEMKPERWPPGHRQEEEGGDWG